MTALKKLDQPVLYKKHSQTPLLSKSAKKQAALKQYTNAAIAGNMISSMDHPLTALINNSMYGYENQSNLHNQTVAAGESGANDLV